MSKIKVVNAPRNLNTASYTSCIILTSEKKIMLQKRPASWSTYPNYISTFGGTIHAEETPLQAIIRELAEEVGAAVHPKDLVFLDAYTEELTQHKEIIFGYFWHDKKETITGCYEGQAIYIDHLHELQEYALIIDDVPWLLKRCMTLKLI